MPDNTRAEMYRHLVRLRMVREQIREVETERLQKLKAEHGKKKGPHAMVRLIARVIGIGVETADMLVNEVFSRQFRDRRAVARYIQLAWRFLRFQEDSALAQWFRTRAADGRGSTRKTMIVALARKLLIALWRFVTTGELSDDIVIRPAS